MQVILLLFLPFPSFADFELYQWTHDKMIEVFELEYQEDIYLDEIIYVTHWSEHRDVIKEPKDAVELYGLYGKYTEKNTNTIWVYGPRKIDTLYRDSVLVHELAHFFTKKAIFEEDFNMPRGMIEAVGYYIQNLWLLEQGPHGILLYNDIKKKLPKKIDNFAYMADIIYMMNHEGFLNYALVFFNKDAPRKFQNLKNGFYTRSYPPHH